jgi:hypothetical protein
MNFKLGQSHDFKKFWLENLICGVLIRVLIHIGPYMLRELDRKSCTKEKNNNQAFGFAVQSSLLRFLLFSEEVLCKPKLYPI